MFINSVECGIFHNKGYLTHNFYVCPDVIYRVGINTRETTYKYVSEYSG
jgi:hypothetical protein